MRGKLSFSENNKHFACDAEILNSLSKVKPLFNEKCWSIYREITRKESYPAEIAKKLGLGQQEVYYYINQLKAAGLAELTKKEEKRGGLAKYYSATAKCFAFLPSKEQGIDSKIEGIEKEPSNPLKEFFHPFIKNKVLDAKIVVGAPDSHGEFKARARDAHIAAELACFLGSLCSSLNYPFIFLDTMLESLKKENSNLIIVGGPITNNTGKELGKHLKAHFMQKNAHWVIKSENSGKEYTEDSIGIIEKIKHPYYDDRAILFIAGKRNAGTKAAVLALLQQTREIIKPNTFNKNSYSRIVEGLDLDSDGLIDNVEIVE